MPTDQEKLDQFVSQAVTKAAPDGFTRAETDSIKKDSAAQAGKLKDVNLNLAFARQAVSHVLKDLKLVAANWDERLDTSAEGIWRLEQPALDRAEAQAKRDWQAAIDQANRELAADGSLANRTRLQARLEATHARLQATYQAAFDRSKGKSEAAWDPTDKKVYGNLRKEPDWVGGVKNLENIKTLDRLARKHGGGNCAELTAVAFLYLYTLNIRPLDFVALKNPADHAFVVIGRKRGTDNDPIGRTWGKDAVVCDPWAPGVIIPPAAGSKGPARTFGEAYAVYTADLLESKMKAMHPAYSGVTFEHPEP